jgi:UPF0271 protein
MGEGAGADEELMPLVSSANVACGGHAGDNASMRTTVQLARRHGVAVGAHPSYPDRAGFGRERLTRAPTEVRADVAAQVRALLAICREERVPLVHVKPHGALYNAAAGDADLARAIAEAVRLVDPGLVVVCLAGSPMVALVRGMGLACAEEAFADRGYTALGTLVPRGQPGALLVDPAAVAERASRLARERSVMAADGTMVPVAADTLCLHGDTPGAAALARAVRERLRADGVAVRALARRG